MRPYVELQNVSKALSYTLGLSTEANFIDQKRYIMNLLPGYQTLVKVIPQIVGTSEEFDLMDQSSRNCKLPHEIENFTLIHYYTRRGCEFECAAKKAISLCHCIPWFYTNNFTNIPVCDSFSAACFDAVMSDESNYKHCPNLCLQTCSTMPMTVVTAYLPIDTEELCKKTGTINDPLMQLTKQHFAFENYKSLVSGDGKIPDLKTGLENGSLCKKFVETYVAQVNVESSTSTVTKSIREPKVTFIDQLGTIGGTLGLFTGMSILSMIEVCLFLFSFVKSILQCNKTDTIVDKIKKMVTRKTHNVRKNKEQPNIDCRQEIVNLKELIIELRNENKVMKKMLMLVLPEDKKLELEEQTERKVDIMETPNVVLDSSDVESNIKFSHKSKEVIFKTVQS